MTANTPTKIIRIVMKGKTIGRFYPDKNLFAKRVVSGLHLMRMMDAYGMEENIYRRLLQKNSDVLIVENNQKHLNSHIKDWEEHGVSRDFGHGMQRFLSRKHMK